MLLYRTNNGQSNAQGTAKLAYFITAWWNNWEKMLLMHNTV